MAFFYWVAPFSYDDAKLRGHNVYIMSELVNYLTQICVLEYVAMTMIHDGSVAIPASTLFLLAILRSSHLLLVSTM